MEPEWTRKIPSKTICDFFYAFYLINLVFLVISLVMAVTSFFHMKKLGFAGVLLTIQGFLMIAIGVTQMLFNYLICDRALLSKEGFGFMRTVLGCGQL
jgi:hypothetical protein